jgi:CheY-like chemotaxis protein
MESLSRAGILFDPVPVPDPLISASVGGQGRRRQHRARIKTKRSVTGRDTARVLLVGLIRELALYRAEVLRHHGFLVHTPATVDQARAIIERGDFDIAVLSYTLPTTTVEEIAEQVRDRCPDCRIVAISETDRIDRRIAPDAVALAQEGPPALIAALRHVLRSH